VLGLNNGMWAFQAHALASRYRVIRYDMRGHGESEAPAGFYSMERLGRDALCVLDSLGIPRAAICGLSIGGMVSQWVAANAAPRVTKLVLANTSTYMGPPQVLQNRIETVLSKGMAAVADILMERWFTDGFRAARPDRVDFIRSMLLSTPAQGYAGCCAAVRDMDHRSILGAITAPTLVIGGRFDASTPLAKAEELAAAITGADLCVLDTAHLSSIEREGEFTAALNEFLGR
jgi:3-oxoadipate enol-lactonase